MFLTTEDGQLPWVKYHTGEYTWWGRAMETKEFLKVIKYAKGIKYICPKQYKRLSKYMRFIWGDVKPFGWWR